MRKLTCDKNIEVLGNNVQAILENLQADEIRPFAIKHGLDNIDPNAWYPCHKWLDLMNDLAEQTNFTQNLVAIGMKLAEKVVLPPHMADATYGDFLLKWDEIYHHQHRGGEIGHHHMEQLGEKKFKGTFTGFYPDNLTYGVAFGFGRRFLPQGTAITITYDDIDNRMDNGGADQTIMLIEWQ